MLTYFKYLNIRKLKRLFKKMKSTSRKRSIQQEAFLLIIKYQLGSIFLSIIFALCSIYFNYRFIYTLIFLYPIIEVGIEGYSIVRQEPGAANRYNAIGALQLLYFLIFIPTLLVVLVSIYFSFKITLLVMLVLYLISTVRAILNI